MLLLLLLPLFLLLDEKRAVRLRRELLFDDAVCQAVVAIGNNSENKVAIFFIMDG